MTESAHPTVRPASGSAAVGSVDRPPVPTLRLGSWSIAFPALPEVMPLLYFGILTLLVAAILAFTQASVSLGRLPFWWYLLGLGLIAVIGSLAAAHIGDEDEVEEGDTVGDDLIAVRAEHWAALQGSAVPSASWEEEPSARPSDPVSELEQLHEEIATAHSVAVQAESPELSPSEAVGDPVAPQTVAAAAALARIPRDPEGFGSRVPPVTQGSTNKAPAAASLAGSFESRRIGRPVARCANCDRTEVPMDPTFTCGTCGRGMCLDCAGPALESGNPSVCPVCRTFADFNQSPTPSRTPVRSRREPALRPSE